MMNNQELIELNELNKESNGGTELTTRNLFHRLSSDELDGVQIITARVRDLDPDRIKIYHLHHATHTKYERKNIALPWPY